MAAHPNLLMVWYVDIGGSFVKLCKAGSFHTDRVPITSTVTVEEVRKIIRAHVPDGEDMVLSCQMGGYVLYDVACWGGLLQVQDFVSWQENLTPVPDDYPVEHAVRVTGVMPRETVPAVKLLALPKDKHYRVLSLCEAVLTQRTGHTHETMACSMGCYNLETRSYDPLLTPPNCTFDKPVAGIGAPSPGRLDNRRVLGAFGDMQVAFYGTELSRCINIGTGSQVISVDPKPYLRERRPGVDGTTLHCQTQIPAGRALSALAIPWDELSEGVTPRAAHAVELLAKRYQDIVGPDLGAYRLCGGVARRLHSVPRAMGCAFVFGGDEVIAGLRRLASMLAPPLTINGKHLRLVRDDYVVRAPPATYSYSFSDDLKLAFGDNVLVVADKDVAFSHPWVLAHVVVKATECNKTLDGGVAHLLNEFVQRNVTKSTTVVGVGGGIIQDVVGFACAVFKRGVPWVYVPTTLLGMCDSCIGGKVGINHRGVKNLVGLFAAPEHVLINTRFLNTLPPRETLNGYGEMVKFAALAGGNAFDHMLDHLNDPDEMIRYSLAVKNAVVAVDPFDSNERLALNLGHTVGHAIEAATYNRVSHGVAVAFGIEVVRQTLAPEVAWPESYYAVFRHILTAFQKEQGWEPLDKAAFVKAVMQDKKNKGTQVCFAVMRGDGVCFVEYHEGTADLMDRFCLCYERLNDAQKKC